MDSSCPRIGVARRDLRLVSLGAVAFALGVADPALVTAQEGRVRCAITTNGTPATGTIAVDGPANKTIAGACGSPLGVPAGKWKATVRLDGAMDHPAKTVDVSVKADRESRVAVDFKTGTLQVQITARGGSGTGVVLVNRGPERIGTLGAGVTALLSAGTYQITVRYGEAIRRYEVTLRPGQRRLIRAQF